MTLRFTWKGIRLTLLMLLLIFVADSVWHRTSSLQRWDTPVEIILHPINFDGTPSNEAYIQALDTYQFADIADFIDASAKAYGVRVYPIVVVTLAPQIDSTPPVARRYTSGLSSIIGSLKLRFWAYWHTDDVDSVYHHVDMYLLYHRHQNGVVLPQSLALQKNQTAFIHLFASQSQRAQNHIIIAHELLHLFGATDKYSYQTLQPLYPEGFANPNQSPRYPQKKAAIMAGRIPITQTTSEIPKSLSECIVSESTAKEIHWAK